MLVLSGVNIPLSFRGSCIFSTVQNSVVLDSRKSSSTLVFHKTGVSIDKCINFTNI